MTALSEGIMLQNSQRTCSRYQWWLVTLHNCKAVMHVCILAKYTCQWVFSEAQRLLSEVCMVSTGAASRSCSAGSSCLAAPSLEDLVFWSFVVLNTCVVVLSSTFEELLGAYVVLQLRQRQRL
jgi:hypothetical protein